MPRASSIAARLDRLGKICLALPETKILVTGRANEHRTFKVRGKTFAYYLFDHHADGHIALCCKVPPGMQTPLIASDPERFYRPAYLGASGWIALDLHRGKINWGEVTALVTESYCLLAPKRLAALVGASPPSKK